MNSHFLKLGAMISASIILSACVIAPPQPLGYRMTSSELPTYVNGQYVGMQPNNYILTSSSNEVPVSSATYLPANAPIYYYDPYYPYDYADPWYDPGFAFWGGWGGWYGSRGYGRYGHGGGYGGHGGHAMGGSHGSFGGHGTGGGHR